MRKIVEEKMWGFGLAGRWRQKCPNKSEGGKSMNAREDGWMSRSPKVLVVVDEENRGK
jgi:hypothetical protein